MMFVEVSPLSEFLLVRRLAVYQDFANKGRNSFLSRIWGKEFFLRRRGRIYQKLRVMKNPHEFDYRSAS